MLVKTFQARDMAEAVKMVKAEFGADAMIISSRQERRKGLMGFFTKPYCEVTAGFDNRPAPRPSPPNPYAEEKERSERPLSAREEFQNSMLGPLARELRELRERVEQLSTRERSGAGADAPMTPQRLMQSIPAPERSTGPERISREELDEIKRFLLQAVNGKEKERSEPVPFVPRREQASDAVMRAAAVPAETRRPEVAPPPAAPPAPSVMDECAAMLERSGLDGEHIETVLESVREGSSAGESAAEVQERCVDAIAGMVRCAGPLRLKRNVPRVLAFIGPTGVGKTTTVAKLAALYALNKGAKVALVTTDTFRVGAVEQLRSYARIMGLPVEEATTPRDLETAIESHSDKDLILIDTAGRSPRDRERIDELQALLDPRLGIETHLCVSATTREREVADIVARFGGLPVNRLLFTKFDESDGFGSVANAQLASGFPLSYFTGGQKVPEDIEVATPRKLATLIAKEITP